MTGWRGVPAGTPCDRAPSGPLPTSQRPPWCPHPYGLGVLNTGRLSRGGSHLPFPLRALHAQWGFPFDLGERALGLPLGLVSLADPGQDILPVCSQEEGRGTSWLRGEARPTAAKAKDRGSVT